MIGQMAIATALLGFNDLGRSGTPTFLFRNRFYLQLTIISTLLKNEQKINVGSKKKFQDFSPGTWNPAILRLQGARNVHLNHIWQRTFPFKAPIAIFWDLQPLWPSSLTNPDLLRFRCSSGHVLS